MKRKERLILTFVLLVTSFSYVLSHYFYTNQSYDIQEMMRFIASCGNYLQSSFSNTKKEQLDFFIVILSIIVVMVTLIYSIKYLILPGEGEKSHIKYKILDNEKSS